MPVFAAVHGAASRLQLQRFGVKTPGSGLEQLRRAHVLSCQPCCREGEVRKSNAGISNTRYRSRKSHQGSSVGSS